MSVDFRVHQTQAAAEYQAQERPNGVDRSRFAALAGGRTPLSEAQARHQLWAAWSHCFGTPPSEPTLVLLLAQWALETGRGNKMRGYNFGGIKADARTEHSALLSTTEGAADAARKVRCRFRTYADAESGARDYVVTLATRYPEAAAAAQLGAASGFVDALEQRRYFTGDAAAYKRAIVSLAGEYANSDRLSVSEPNELVSGVLSAFQRAIARRG